MVQRRPEWLGMKGNQDQEYHSSRRLEKRSVPPSARSTAMRSTSPSKLVGRAGARSSPPEQAPSASMRASMRARQAGRAAISMKSSLLDRIRATGNRPSGFSSFRFGRVPAVLRSVSARPVPHARKPMHLVDSSWKATARTIQRKSWPVSSRLCGLAQEREVFGGHGVVSHRLQIA